MKIENCKLKIFEKYKAFSLIEMMIVIAIIGIMTAVGVVSLNAARSSSSLKTAQREVTAAIKLAQSYALQGRTQEYPAGSGIFVTPCGYGVKFDNDRMTYHIFYNPVGTGAYNNCEERNADRTGRGWTNAAQIQSINSENYSIKNGVTLSSNINNAQIYFTVPHTNMFDWQGDPYAAPRTVSFSLAGLTKTITINNGGFVAEN